MFACGATGFLAKWEVCVWWVSRLVLFVSVRMRRVGGGYKADAGTTCWPRSLNRAVTKINCCEHTEAFYCLSTHRAGESTWRTHTGRHTQADTHRQHRAHRCRSPSTWMWRVCVCVRVVDLTHTDTRAQHNPVITFMHDHNVTQTLSTSKNEHHTDAQARKHSWDLKVTDNASSAVTHTHTDTHRRPASASHTLLIWEPVQITRAQEQAITWEKWDDPLLRVFLPSLNWELVEYLHLWKHEERKRL